MTIEQLSYHDQLLLAKVKLNYYTTDVLDFQAYNAVRFTATWHIDWQAAIDAAEAFISDEDVIDQSTTIAMEVETLMQQARKLYQKYIKPFVEDAFEKDEGKKNLFGFDDYAESVTTASRMVIFLKKLHAQCLAHQSALIAVGLDATKIADIDTLHNDLQTKMIAQASFQGTRMSSAQDRKAVYATMNEFTHQTCRTGKIIYKDENEAKYRMYLLPVPTAAAEPMQTIAAGAKIIVINNATEEDYYFLENKGDTTLRLYIATSTQAAVPTTAATITPQSSKTLAATELGFDLNNTPHLLILWNEDTSIAGKYRLEKME